MARYDSSPGVCGAWREGGAAKKLTGANSGSCLRVGKWFADFDGILIRTYDGRSEGRDLEDASVKM